MPWKQKNHLPGRQGVSFCPRISILCNDSRAGLATGGVNSVPTACLLPGWCEGRPAEHTQSLLDASLTQEAASGCTLMEALTDTGRTLQFLAIGQKGAFTLAKADVGQDCCFQDASRFYSPLASCCPLPAPRTVMSPGRIYPYHRAPLPHTTFSTMPLRVRGGSQGPANAQAGM